MYKIEYSKRVKKDLSHIPKKDLKKIFAKIDQLLEDPRKNGVKRLASTKMELYRIRSGRYRVVYSVYDQSLTVLVLRVAHRKEVYAEIQAVLS